MGTDSDTDLEAMAAAAFGNMTPEDPIQVPALPAVSPSRSAPGSVFSDLAAGTLDGTFDEKTPYFVAKNSLAIVAPKPTDPSEYETFELPRSYRYRKQSNDLQAGSSLLSLRSRRRASGSPRQRPGRISELMASSDDDSYGSFRSRRPRRTTAGQRFITDEFASGSETDTSDFEHYATGDSSRASRRRSDRKTRKGPIYTEPSELDDSEDENGDHLSHGRYARSSRLILHPPKSSRSSSPRRSERTRRVAQRSRLIDEDEDDEKAEPRFAGAKEYFQPVSSDSPFCDRHCQTCDICDEVGDSHEKGSLIFCQGCVVSYHQKCLGHRNRREHLVSKIGDQNFVLQCRRCVALAKSKEFTAPDFGICTSCGESGAACSPFRSRKTARQEQKEREDNDGEDPIVKVDAQKINNSDNVLFRCLTCYRAWHFHHLPPRHGFDTEMVDGGPSSVNTDDLFRQYAIDWQCQTCIGKPGDIDAIIAWRPLNPDIVTSSVTNDRISEESKQYLLKWKSMPHTDNTWAPGPWVWSVTSAAMRKAFTKKDSLISLLKATLEEAVPEDFVRIDIVFDVEHLNGTKFTDRETDRMRIKNVQRALVKFKGLGYEDVVWTDPPKEDAAERFNDWKIAYQYWIMGRYTSPPNAQTLSKHLSSLRTMKFGEDLEIKDQPVGMTGGKVMDYQRDGINWLYYKWFHHTNCILADEMGLGKTIQVIGFLSQLKEKHTCWPFLVVVPNSTCPNWRREIKAWAPGLRVVTYYGSAEARRLAARYELFPRGPNDLACHVVVTSYDAAQDVDFRGIFRSVKWAGLVVDEGQRLKNDKSLLFGALQKLRIGSRLLLTGTPLQNNVRELFNLLQFLDDTKDAEALDEEYAALSKDGRQLKKDEADLYAAKVKELHEELKPIFLRRTKAQVLTSLPSMAQIIVPVSLSPLQRKLYKSILAKNPELIKSIMGVNGKTLKQSDRANLNNILMQLRKCLSHPFIYSRSIEERTRDPTSSFRNLVDASSKLQLLELMLPRLRDRGHRVLIFSQFLDMLTIVEDFWDFMGLRYQRLDGSMGSLEKQKRIDQFNAPDSSLFAFLLSTRAGGIGINLASADTVIILDPDFNPHQDIQALSRAHRIGQRKKVLVFQLITRSTAEEKIVQIGKRKLMLDQVVIEQMDVDDDAGMNLESILRHGTEALFADDGSEDIKYNGTLVDQLLERTQTEEPPAHSEKSAESQFSFAKVWVNDKGNLEDQIQDQEQVSDPSLWDKILKQREMDAALENSYREKEFGRGRRKRGTVDYKQLVEDPRTGSPAAEERSRSSDRASDTDFKDDDSDTVSDTSSIHSFKRAELPTIDPQGMYLLNGQTHVPGASYKPCVVCNGFHPPSRCPLRLAGVEYCNLCGLAHYGMGQVCPHLNSMTQLRAMLDAIEASPEAVELKAMAKKRIDGYMKDVSQRKRQKNEAEGPDLSSHGNGSKHIQIPTEV